MDWLIGVLLTVLVAALVVGWSTYVFMATMRTTFPFAPEELQRFNVRKKLASKGIVPTDGPRRGLYYHTPLAKIQRHLHPKG